LTKRSQEIAISIRIENHAIAVIAQNLKTLAGL
jgi:hypothetical protein